MTELVKRCSRLIRISRRKRSTGDGRRRARAHHLNPPSAVRQRRRRNRILTNLLQQLPAVRQIANADLLVQFRGVVVLGAMNYGSRGNHEAVASAVTKVFRDRIKQERRIRRLKEMDKRYHLLDPTIVPRHSSGGGIHRAPSWSTIEEVLPETEVRWGNVVRMWNGW
jgi:hypothetical protein